MSKLCRMGLTVVLRPHHERLDPVEANVVNEPFEITLMLQRVAF